MTTGDHKWPRVTTSDHRWPPVTTSDHEWPRVTTNDHVILIPDKYFNYFLIVVSYSHSWSLVCTLRHDHRFKSIFDVTKHNVSSTSHKQRNMFLSRWLWLSSAIFKLWFILPITFLLQSPLHTSWIHVLPDFLLKTSRKATRWQIGFTQPHFLITRWVSSPFPI